MSEQTAALLLFIKAPRAGAVKTRLTPLLTPEGAARLAPCLASDAVRLARAALPPPEGRLVIAYAPDDGWPDLAALLPSSILSPDPPLAFAQRGGDLGERMASAVAHAAAQELGPPFVLLGVDCPTLPQKAIRAAFAAVSGDGAAADVVLGPAEDGGYYLVGLRDGSAAQGLFSGVAWSTSSVLTQTVANAARLGLRVDTDLPLCYDIDTPADLIRLRDDLAAHPALRAQAPATARWLEENPLKGGDAHP